MGAVDIAPAKGSLPVLQYCQPGQLAVDPTYQRELDGRSRQLILRIVKGWDWNLFQPLVVARRQDGALFVVDGQHRLEAARQRGDIQQLPCVIFQSAGEGDEAGIFVALNQERRPLTPFALWKGAIASGDEQALALQALLDQVGLRFAGSADTEKLKPGEVNQVGRIRRWHARNGDAATRRALHALARVVKGQGPRNAGMMFAAICAVVLEHGEALNGHLFADLLDRTAKEWNEDFHRRAAQDGIGTEAAAVAVIRDAYVEAVAEVAGDEAPAPIAAPDTPRGPAKINLGSVASSMEKTAAGWRE